MCLCGNVRQKLITGRLFHRKYNHKNQCKKATRDNSDLSKIAGILSRKIKVAAFRRSSSFPRTHDTQDVRSNVRLLYGRARRARLQVRQEGRRRLRAQGDRPRAHDEPSRPGERYFRLLLSEGGFYGAPIAPATAADIDARLARSVPGVRDRPVWCFRASRARASLVARANPRARAPPIVLDCKSERG
eukprot:31418-Pelagococcus_subviridis.AAC.6